MSASVLEAILRRDRAIIIAALSLLTVLAWADRGWLADDMSMGGMDMTGFRMIPAEQGLMMPASAPWQPVEFAYVFAMWTIMMIGMMTPSVAPMILIYTRVGRQAVMGGHPFAASGWFASGYLIAWAGFSLAATSAQWALERAALLTPMMESASNVLGGIVLIAAGDLSVDSSQGGLPVLLPSAAHFHHATWWISSRANQRAGVGSSPWSVLYRLLLGSDAAAVRWWHHESFLDCSTRNPCVA